MTIVSLLRWAAAGAPPAALINIALNPDKIINMVLSSSHSRFPFWEDHQDNIIGILHIKDLLSKIYNNQGPMNDIEIRSLLSEPIFVSDNALVTQQLQLFRKGQSHLACVVDEYGDLQGIITLEDVLEQIVGQIKDEYDNTDKKKIIKQSNNEYIIDGSIPVRDLNKELNWNIPESDGTTIAGFLINRFERIPNQGECLIEKNLKIIIKNKTNNRIKNILVIVQNLHEFTND